MHGGRSIAAPFASAGNVVVGSYAGPVEQALRGPSYVQSSDDDDAGAAEGAVGEASPPDVSVAVRVAEQPTASVRHIAPIDRDIMKSFSTERPLGQV